MKKEEIKGWKVQSSPKTWIYGPRGEVLLKKEVPKIGFKINERI